MIQEMCSWLPLSAIVQFKLRRGPTLGGMVVLLARDFVHDDARQTLHSGKTEELPLADGIDV